MIDSSASNSTRIMLAMPIGDAGIPIPDLSGLVTGTNPIAVLMIGLAIAAVVFKLAQRVSGGCVVPGLLASIIVVVTGFVSMLEQFEMSRTERRQRKIDRMIKQDQIEALLQIPNEESVIDEPPIDVPKIEKPSETAQ